MSEADKVAGERPATIEEAEALHAEISKHAHLRRESLHAVAMAKQSGCPIKIAAAEEQHVENMKVVAASPYSQRDIDRAAQLVLDAQGYVPPKES
jgi:hypothetical protein